MVAGLLLDLDKAAELVNFGACAGFMVVNLCAIGNHFVQRRERRGVSAWKYLVSPAIGFLVCLWIWLSVSPLAMKVGALWSLAGIAYLIVLIRRNGVDRAASRLVLNSHGLMGGVRLALLVDLPLNEGHDFFRDVEHLIKFTLRRS